MRQADLKIEVQKRVHRLMRSTCKLNLYTHSSGYLDWEKIISQLNIFIIDMNYLVNFLEYHICDEENKDYEQNLFPMTAEEIRQCILNAPLPPNCSIWKNTENK